MKNKCSRIVHNQHFFHKAYNMPYNALNCIVGHSQASMLKMPCNGSLSAYKCSIPIYRKITIDGHFENFRVNIQANNTLPNHGYFSCYTYIDFSRKFTNLIKKSISYYLNRFYGIFLSIVYYYDMNSILRKDINCKSFSIKNGYKTECKYGNLQSDFPVISRNRV